MAVGVITNGNQAEVILQDGANVSIKAKTHSSRTQKVTIRNHERELYVFSGSGERATIGDVSLTVGPEYRLYVTFENSDGTTSRLQWGGPYMIGNYIIMTIVAETGDDADYDDCILEFTWIER